MSIANDRLQVIRKQVEQHLDHAEKARLSEQQVRELKDDISAQLQREDAVLVAHYYTAPEIQALAEESGGCVSDSLEWHALATITRHPPW